jgi:hypothetical protein
MPKLRSQILDNDFPLIRMLSENPNLRVLLLDTRPAIQSVTAQGAAADAGATRGSRHR